MTEPQENRQRKRLTYTATAEGIQMAERALKRFGNKSREAFAGSMGMSRSTLNNFFNRVGIQLNSLQRICDALGLNWLEITGLKSDASAVGVSEILLTAIGSDVKEKSRTSERIVTVKDGGNGNIKAVLILSGDVNSDTNLISLQSFIKHHVGDSIQIEDIREGSIKLFLSGSLEDIEKLRTLIDSGELSELDGLPIQSIEITEDWRKEKEKSNNKWKLVEDIITNLIINRQLQEIDLSDTDLSGTYLSGADLSGAYLLGADLSGAYLLGADLSSAYLSGADLSSANLSSAYLFGANLSGADLFGAYLRSANLRNAYLRSANLRNADLSGADLSGANLFGANLSSAYLIGADLRNAYLSSAYLIGADLRNAYLIGAYLIGADFRNTDLRSAYLSDADLSGADLIGANLRNADLRSAYLLGADLSGADLSGADLRSAYLSDARVQNAIFTNTFGVSDLDRIDLENRGAIFGDRPPVLVGAR
jgi:uncharacterized protein YjbI with pentapeptide repeats/transcriptional regulator with XRE-family HTH domain